MLQNQVEIGRVDSMKVARITPHYLTRKEK
jgi:hypothetical protein